MAPGEQRAESPLAKGRDAEHEKTTSEQPTAPPNEQDDYKSLHSIFSSTQKKMIVLTASTAAFFSPLSSNIYLPALNVLAEDLHVSDAKINITITTYLVRSPLFASNSHPKH